MGGGGGGAGCGEARGGGGGGGEGLRRREMNPVRRQRSKRKGCTRLCDYSDILGVILVFPQSPVYI